MENPRGIVKTFKIPYGDEGEGLFLEGRVRAVTEEGHTHANWFEGEVRYPGRCEIGGIINDPEYQTVRDRYQRLKRGAPTLEEVKRTMRLWCKSMKLEIASETQELVGVKDYLLA